METRQINFVSFHTDGTYIFGLDAEGNIWYRHKPVQVFPYEANKVLTSKEKEKKEEEAIWKPLEMAARVKQDPLPEPRYITADDPSPVKVERLEPETTPKVGAGSEDKPIAIICETCDTTCQYKPTIDANHMVGFWCASCREHVKLPLTPNNWYKWGLGSGQYTGEINTSRHGAWKEKQFDGNYGARH